MLIFHNPSVQSLVRSCYTPRDTAALRSFLDRQGTFEFPVLPTGLFAAARLTEETQYTGYDNVWVRDNVQVAHAHHVDGRSEVAARTVEALRLYFQQYAHRFRAVIAGEADPEDPMNRPHVRFNGLTLEENPETWSHAQNDALGYFLWLYCQLARAGHVTPDRDAFDLLGLFPPYFRAIRYWEDEDSGHWEEARKVEASSIGTVVAALRELRLLLADRLLTAIPGGDERVTAEAIGDLERCGLAALREILPNECVQPDNGKRRRCDAALLFLIYPLCVVEGVMADQILHDVETHLRGEYGIRRYLGDSFWCADYRALQRPELRTADVSRDMSGRDALLRPGQEAQWCLFDPLLSTIYGRRYADTGKEAFLQKQVHYLNRSLGQLTGPDSGFPEFRCPELYSLDEGRYVPNDVTPLLWTQAHLITALNQMQSTAQIAAPPGQSLNGGRR